MACGAPGTATWLGVEIRDGNIGREDLVGFKVRIGRENGYTTVLKMEDAEGPFFNNVGNHQNYYFPLSIPEVNSAFGNNGTFKGNYSTNYGYFMVELQPIPNPEKYIPWDSDKWYEIRSGFLLTQRAYSGENRPQWILSNLDATEPGYNEFWTYYSNSSNYRESREYGGLTIWSKSNRDIISLRGSNDNETQGYLDKEHDCIKFGGEGNFGSSYSDTDNQLVLSFWVNRPGKIKLSYGFNPGNSGNCYWAAKVRGTNSLIKWEMTDQNKGYLTMNAEGTGSLDFPSGPEKVNSDGTFKTPVEIGIYPVGGAAFIYSIEFIPE